MNNIPSQCNKFVTTPTKCDTKDTLCNQSGDTCATVLENLDMSVKHVYMIIKTHYYKYFPLKQAKTQLYARSSNSPCQKTTLTI